MSIAQRVIEEIVRQGMVSAHDENGPIERPVIFVWNGNAEEQIEAVIANELAKGGS